jgi:hypothetical protein
MVFPRGEGLPGRVWEEKQPLVLNHFRGGASLNRADAAARAGLGAGLGFPIYRANQCVAVCTLLFSSVHPRSGVIEVWSQRGSQNTLSLATGYYGRLDGFRRQSATMKFPLGTGLPGRVLETHSPILLDNLSCPETFSRITGAESFGLRSGLGLPIVSPLGTSAIVMLAGQAAPLASTIEIWTPAPDGQSLTLGSVSYHEQGASASTHRKTSCRKGEGLPGLVWEGEAPLVIGQPQRSAPQLRSGPAPNDSDVGIGIPVIDGERVVAVVILLS